jgi:hypothetical protein
MKETEPGEGEKRAKINFKTEAEEGKDQHERYLS